MADGIIRRFVRVVFDRGSAKKAEQELVAGMGDAGKKSGDAFVRELKTSFAKEMSSLKQQLAKGLIDEKEFRKRADQAAKTFNKGIIEGMDKARKAGTLTDREFIKLGSTLKRTGDLGALAGDRIMAAFARLGATLVATFGIQAGIRFLTKSIEAALDAEKSIDRLDSALRPLGLSYKQVGKAAEVYLERLQETTKFSDEDAREALTALIVGTGDYKRSLELLDVTAKIAEKRQISMADAAAVAIKLNQGLTKGMLDLGIGAGETGDLIKKVNDNLGDFAVKAGKTNEGVLKRAANLWDEFQENIGLAVLGSEAWKDGSTGLIKTLMDMNKWVQENNKSIGEAADSVAKLVLFLGKLALGVIEFGGDSFGFLDKRLRPLKELPVAAPITVTGPEILPGAAGTRGKPTGKGGKKTDAEREADRAEKKSAQDRLELAREIAVRTLQIEEQLTQDLATEQIRRQEILGNAVKVTFGTMQEGFDQLDELNRQIKIFTAAGAAGFQDDLQPAIKQTESVMLTATDNMVEALDRLDQKTAESASNWSRGMQILHEEVENNRGLIDALAESWAEGNLRGLAGYAMAKVKENLAWVIENIALALGSLGLGNPVAAGHYTAAAAKHGAAAAAWKAVANATGGGGGGGGASAAGGSAGAGTGGTAAASKVEDQAINIYLTGPGWNALNPEVQKVVRGAIDQAQDRYGNNTKVRVQRAAP